MSRWEGTGQAPLADRTIIVCRLFRHDASHLSGLIPLKDHIMFITKQDLKFIIFGAFMLGVSFVEVLRHL
jgi:hypothetical protein